MGRLLNSFDGEIFSISGPVQLAHTGVDWTNEYHVQIVMASLIQTVYVLERDRQKKRQGHQALAPPWSKCFHFELFFKLEDPNDKSVFGAIFQYKFPPFYYNQVAQNRPPRYVIAFRGTMIKPDTVIRDIRLDIRIFQNTLHQSGRFQHAMNEVQKMVDMAGAANIWLAGHSLGSSIALLGGENMFKAGYPIETYLFNPPFLSVPIETMFKSKVAKEGVRLAKNVVTATTVAFLRHRNDDSFDALSSWTPHLFVNWKDSICNEYIGYFNYREKMMTKIGARTITRVAMKNSFRCQFSQDSKPSHLLPSAYLIINESPSQHCMEAHAIEQWWKPNM